MAKTLTRNQTLVLETLEKAEGPLSAYAILDQLRDQGFRAPLQVYRALESLIVLKRIHRLESMNAFMSCRHPSGCGHGIAAFAICNDCGTVEELDDHKLAHDLQHLTAEIGFTAKHSTIEIRGICQRCTTK